jgi:hypothetical protein
MCLIHVLKDESNLEDIIDANTLTSAMGIS